MTEEIDISKVLIEGDTATIMGVKYQRVEELKELRDTSTIPITKFTTHDIDSINDSFLQIAEKVKNKEAQVTSMNMDYEHHTHTQRITFEVLTNF